MFSKTIASKIQFVLDFLIRWVHEASKNREQPNSGESAVPKIRKSGPEIRKSSPQIRKSFWPISGNSWGSGPKRSCWPPPRPDSASIPPFSKNSENFFIWFVGAHFFLEQILTRFGQIIRKLVIYNLYSFLLMLRFAPAQTNLVGKFPAADLCYDLLQANLTRL